MVEIHLLAETVQPAGDELSASAYLVILVASVVIFGGLIWAFYRAIRAAGREEENNEVTKPESSETESRGGE
jgi:hypothetical protein